MENLLRFLRKSSALFLFLLLELIAVLLMINHHKYHQWVFLSSSNLVSGTVYDVHDATTGYFYLRHQNELLLLENTALLEQNQFLAQQNQQVLDSIALIDSSFCTDSILIDTTQLYHYIPAKVVNISTNKVQNYITINKGAKDGLAPDMGVLSSQGAVGVVSTVSKHFAVVIPILNPLLRLSCRLDSSNYYGSLVWNGVNANYAFLEEIPRHVEVTIGEQIKTSGFSSVFPAGIPVGTVEEVELDKSENFYIIQIRLAVEFRQLSQVKVLTFTGKEEMSALETIIQE